MRDGLNTRQMTFHTTHWSDSWPRETKTARRRARPSPAFVQPIGIPCMRSFAGGGYGPQEAEDLTQEFFYRFLQQNSLANVSPGAGKFRSFLLACLKHFLAKDWERAHAQRRGGGRALIALDAGSAETRYQQEPADPLTPEVLFERRWAFTVLERTLQRLEEEYARRKNGELFEQLKGFLPGCQGSGSRAEVATKRAVSAGAINVAIHRLRQRFGTLLREQVAETVSSAEEVEQEIHYLISVLGT